MLPQTNYRPINEFDVAVDYYCDVRNLNKVVVLEVIKQDDKEKVIQFVNISKAIYEGGSPVDFAFKELDKFIDVLTKQYNGDGLKKVVSIMSWIAGEIVQKYSDSKTLDLAIMYSNVENSIAKAINKRYEGKTLKQELLQLDVELDPDKRFLTMLEALVKRDVLTKKLYFDILNK